MDQICWTCSTLHKAKNCVNRQSLTISSSSSMLSYSCTTMASATVISRQKIVLWTHPHSVLRSVALALRHACVCLAPLPVLWSIPPSHRAVQGSSALCCLLPPFAMASGTCAESSGFCLSSDDLPVHLGHTFVESGNVLS